MPFTDVTPAFLPEPLPGTPMQMFEQWFAEARSRALQPNPDAMTLATVGADGSPSARIVLCKQLVADPGYIVFFTNYHSRKGHELAATPRAAVVIHWDALHRQVRLEGQTVKSPPEESDAYFAVRPLQSRIGAWASEQSQPLASRAQLTLQVREAARRFGIAPDATSGEVPRPSHWGGFRLWPDAIELWVEGPGRVHDRARWTRTLTRHDAHTCDASPWHGSRLNP